MKLKEYKTYNSNGKLKFRHHVNENDDWHGVSEHYYRDGTLKVRGHWINNVKSGLWCYKRKESLEIEYYL